MLFPRKKTCTDIYKHIIFRARIRLFSYFLLFKIRFVKIIVKMLNKDIDKNYKESDFEQNY